MYTVLSKARETLLQHMENRGRVPTFCLVLAHFLRFFVNAYMIVRLHKWWGFMYYTKTSCRNTRWRKRRSLFHECKITMRLGSCRTTALGRIRFGRRRYRYRSPRNKTVENAKKRSSSFQTNLARFGEKFAQLVFRWNCEIFSRNDEAAETLWHEIARVLTIRYLVAQKFK